MKIIIILIIFLPICYLLFFNNLFDFGDKLIANYTYQRNDQNLMTALNFSKINNRKEEENFLEKLYSKNLSDHFSNENPKDLSNHTVILVVAGFFDFHTAYCYRAFTKITEEFKQEQNKISLFFREHDQHKDMNDLINYFAKQNSKIILVGHSWGGSSATLKIAEKNENKIDLLVTLDPVGIFRPNHKPNTNYWLNIYVDYKKADYGLRNNVARLGRPWEYAKFADENIASDILEHENATELYFKYANDKVKNIIHANKI